MIPKAYRLTRKDFAPFRSLKPIKHFSTRAFFVKTIPNTAGHNRFAVVVGISVSKKSTTRHKIKRMFYENLAEGPNFKKDFLIILLPYARDITREEVKKEFKQMFEKIKHQSSNGRDL